MAQIHRAYFCAMCVTKHTAPGNTHQPWASNAGLTVLIEFHLDKWHARASLYARFQWKLSDLAEALTGGT
jgi:hypothetical protein